MLSKSYTKRPKKSLNLKKTVEVYNKLFNRNQKKMKEIKASFYVYISLLWRK